MRILLILLLLPSCAGYSYKPSLSYEDEDGHKISASITIKPSGKSPRSVIK